MKPYEERVVEEKRELDEKRAKLDAFSDTSIFDGLPEEHQKLLVRQAVLMDLYSEVLAARIATFEP